MEIEQIFECDVCAADIEEGETFYDFVTIGRPMILCESCVSSCEEIRGEELVA